MRNTGLTRIFAEEKRREYRLCRQRKIGEEDKSKYSEVDDGRRFQEVDILIWFNLSENCWFSLGERYRSKGSSH